MKTFTEMANPWVEGLFTYEPGRPVEEVARELGFESAAEIVKLASNENALGPSPAAVVAMRDAALNMHRYPDGGAFYLKQALAAKLQVSPDQVVLGNGSNEVIELLGHVFLGPDVGIVIADRAFVVYRLVAMAERSDIVAVPMKEFVHDLDAMVRAIRPQTKIVFVANPNNPTGTLVEQDAIDAFMDAVPDHVVVCFDEAYVELLDPKRQPDTLKYVREGRKVVVVRTFSKAYGLAGLRIGYAVAPEECARLLHKVRQPFNVNAMAQAGALAALNDDMHVARTRQGVGDGLAYLESECAKLGLPIVPSVVNFMLVDVRSAAGEAAAGDGRSPGRRVFDALQRAGVIVRPMDGYGLPEYVRVTVGTRGENERCIRALEALLKS